MRSDGAEPVQCKRAKREDDEDGGSGESLILDVFRWWIIRVIFCGLCKPFIVFKNTATLPVSREIVSTDGCD